MEILENLFVYGTLKKGQCNHNLIEDARFISEGKTFKGFCLYDLGEIPIATEESEVSPIIGELYRINKNVLQKVDNIEHPLMRRIETPVILHRSGTVKAWIYIRDDGMNGILIREGKWR